PALHDGGEDLIGPAAVDPLLVHQRRPHAAAALCVAAHAVIPAEEALSLRDFVCVGVVVGASRALPSHPTPGLARLQLGLAFGLRDGIGLDRGLLEAALLALAAGQCKSRREDRAHEGLATSRGTQ